MVSKFSTTPGLCAVRPGLLGVRRAGRDVEGGVGVAKGGGEDVGRSEVCAGNEAGNLGLGNAVAGLSRGVHKCSDRVVSAGGLAQGAAGGVGGACVQGSRLTAQGTGSQGPAHPRRRRTESTYSPHSNTAP